MYWIGTCLVKSFVTRSVRDMQSTLGYRARMVTRIGPTRPRRLYLTEHMERRGLTDDRLAGRLDVARETVTRWRKYQNRLNAPKIAQIAAAMEMEPWELWQHPDRPSVDALLSDASDAEVRRLAEAVTVLRKTGS